MRKAFGLTFIKQCFLVLGCLYGAQFFTGLFSAIDCGPPPVAVGPMGGVASSDVDSTDVNASKQYDACMVKVRREQQLTRRLALTPLPLSSGTSCTVCTFRSPSAFWCMLVRS
jgi:hypothetical protein